MLVNLTVEAKNLRPNAMTNNDTDIDLVQRLLAGEETAIHELYAAYGQRLYTYALRLTNDPDQAKDVVQDTLVAAWKTIRNFRGSSRLLAWLLGIVHHLAIKSLRHRTQMITDEMEETVENGQPSPEKQTESNERDERLRSCLQKLSREHREVLELVFYQGLTLEETAQVCRVPLGTIKSRMNHARRILHGALIREGLEELQ